MTADEFKPGIWYDISTVPKDLTIIEYADLRQHDCHLSLRSKSVLLSDGIEVWEDYYCFTQGADDCQHYWFNVDIDNQSTDPKYKTPIKWQPMPEAPKAEKELAA